MQGREEDLLSATRWTLHGLLFLGLWLIATAFSIYHRSDAIVASDLASGVVVLILTFWALNRPAEWVRWALAIVGVWLQLAPLAFWAPVSASYINDTLVGVLIIALAVLFLREPIQIGDVPRGWTYNPSAWLQRLPVIFLSFIAWMCARLMAAYQLGYIDSVWDPVFGQGTVDVISSPLSKSFPIPDAGLGAMAYTIETLMGAHGSERRWHSLPWFTLLFAFLVIPVGLVSIILIMLQPIIVGHWCFWCLLTAFCMLWMIALSVDEVAATLQFLKRERDAGRLWSSFWRGGYDEHAGPDIKLPENRIKGMFWGINLPWNLLLSALVGGYIMFSAHSDLGHIIGALIVTVSIVATAELARSARYLNYFFAASLLVLALFSSGFSLVNQLAAGVVLALLTRPRGRIDESYGTLNSWIK